ncbi:MAG: FtsW/RodA/SpoVE family cell cycle protein [Propionibacteriaceae bacterium]|jgi:cell division protein FtsW (lipid II flippase)|nr:FtsW/RodA/SpoVE family cell cycle protein [Propionibacteriaceae bacterium]
MEDQVVVYRKRRGTEAVLMLFSVLICVAAYILIHLDMDNEIPQQWPWALGIGLGLAVIVHVIVRVRLPYADPLILPLVFLLNGLGVAMIHRLDLGTNPVMHSAELQLVWTGIAVAVFVLVLVFLPDYEVLNRFPYLLFLLGMFLLLMPMLPGIGQEKFGARIWIGVTIGGSTYSFQPAELAKIVLVIAFAAYLVEKKDVLAAAGTKVLGIEIPRVRDLGPILLMWLASLAVLVFQKDLGTSLLFFGLFVMMLYVATGQAGYPILGVFLFAGGAYAGYLFFGHVQARVDAWLNPFKDFDTNYQVIVGQFGMAYGGATGTGWGLGRPNMTPLAKTDFIVAAFGEELGVAGLAAIILIYAILVARGLRAALGIQEPFGKLLAAGLSFVFAIQVFTIIGGVTRLLPLTGLTTPFLSQGGSSLVANWAMTAILLVVTHYARRPMQVRSRQRVRSLAMDETQQIPRAAL